MVIATLPMKKENLLRPELERLSQNLAITALGRDPTTGLILHDKQLSFVNSKAKRKVICAGRRGGKTTGVAVSAARKFKVERRRVLYAAPTQEQTEQFWEYSKEYFWDVIKTGTIYKNETRRLLEWHGRIRAKTAWDADTMRGDYADEMFFEEFAMMQSSAWDKVGAPMLLDNDGNATFISTPRRRNHFHKMYLKAKADDTGRWECWHFTSFDNPYLSEAALAEIIEDMTDAAYRQEILAEFLEGEGAVFRNIEANLWTPKQEQIAEHIGHRTVVGVDWGKHRDFTTISIVCTECMCEIEKDRFNKIDYTFQRDRLKRLVDKWKPVRVLAEQNAMEANLEMLQREGVRVIGWTMTSANKPGLISNLAVSLEKEVIRWLDDPIWTAELEAFEQQVNKNTGRSSYSAPQGLHDDTVIARALAREAVAMSHRRSIYI